jgi:beta-mannosidase
VKQARTSKWITASVPGDVYADLLKANEIPDPFYRDNENDLQWIGETDWIYQRSFKVPAAVLKKNRVLLQCDGLDTLATLVINGKKIATTDNMFRSWEFDVREVLKAGQNTISITFAAAQSYINKRGEELFLKAGNGNNAGHIRKEPCNFGWDWGVKCVTCGIWRDIRLVAFDTARLSDVRIVQDHSKKGQVGLTVETAVEKTGRQKLSARVTVTLDGKEVGSTEETFGGKITTLQTLVKHPKLWWPNNMGDQPLYKVTVELLDAEGTLLDITEKRIGLRTLELDRHPDQWGESFQFVVNGVPFFAKGANWIPADAIQARMTQERYHQLVQDAAEANMNMLRVWGGGIYEDEAFYDACDELGICVWQDFMYACSGYPTMDKAFMRNVKAETEDVVKRLRHRTCIALWCGNNEIEMLKYFFNNPELKGWTGYKKLFDKLIPDVLSKLDPERTYWPSSPHTPVGDRNKTNDPTCGDAHLWKVWHGKEPFEWYRTCKHRFNSEFGFQSFPEPKTVYGYTKPEDRNITTRVMEHHQRSGIGNTTIMQYMLSWFRLPEGFENVIWVSQIQQGMAMKYACEHWRRSMPRGMGTLYWQLNDNWPVASWSSIDYHGRWKATHYMAINFFAPLLISGLEDPEKGTVEVHVNSDLMQPVNATAEWTVTDLDGKELLKSKKKVRAASGTSRRIATVQLKRLLNEQGEHNLLVWLKLSAPGQPDSTNLVLFARPKYMDLSRKPGIKAVVKKTKDGAFTATLTAKKPALWAWIELEGMDAKLSDNFIHLCPGQSVEVNIIPAKDLTLSELRKRLVVRSLVDTYA